MKKIILLSAFCLLMAMPVTGEYYQYKDSQGNLRFTDDSATIPKDTQTDITAYSSIENDSYQESLETNSSTDSTPEAEDNLSSTDNGKGESIPNREELEALQKALDQTSTLLKTQHEELAAQAPGSDASKIQKEEYSEKVSEMNAKQADYKKQHQAYNEKVSAYNSRIEQEEKDR